MKIITTPNELQLTPEEIKVVNDLRRMPPPDRKCAASIVAKMAEKSAVKRPAFQLIDGGRRA